MPQGVGRLGCRVDDNLRRRLLPSTEQKGTGSQDQDERNSKTDVADGRDAFAGFGEDYEAPGELGPIIIRYIFVGGTLHERRSEPIGGAPSFVTG